MKLLSAITFITSPLFILGQASFVKADAGDLTNKMELSFGGTWIDFDTDGDLDFMNGKYLFTNDGGGIFSADSLGPSGFPPAVVDLNNDGLLDMISTSSRPVEIWINKGGSFEQIFLEDSSDFQDVSCIDYNNDGFLDFFTANGGNLSSPGTDNFLYENVDGTSFTLINEGVIDKDGGQSHMGAWADYDNDGDADLVVVNNTGTSNALYQNIGDGLFSKQINSDISSNDAQNASFSASWGDYNNDGFEDLFITNDTENFLYVNNRNGTFRKESDDQPIVNDIYFSIGSSWGDMDNDGDLDLFVANFDEPKGQLYFNNGDGSFAPSIDLSQQLGTVGLAFGAAAGDYDNDGDLDVYIGATSETGGVLLTNEGNNNSWLEIDLIGTESNRSGIGVKVMVEATVDGKKLKQYKQQRTRNGLFAGNLRLHYGLKDATSIDHIFVEWPSGKTQDFKNVEVNQVLTISEDIITSTNSPIATSISIYPNPGVSDKISINSNYDYHGKVIITFMTLKGEIITNEVVDKNDSHFEHQIVLDKFVSGTYLIKMQMGDMISTHKFIKK